MECIENFVVHTRASHTHTHTNYLQPSPIDLNSKFRFVKSQMSIRNVCTQWSFVSTMMMMSERESAKRKKKTIYTKCVSVFVS